MARIKKYISGHTSTSTAPGTDTSWGTENSGPYIGIVKQNVDPLKMGRLKVLIPALSGSYKQETDNLIECKYLSPFYGNKGLNYVTAGNKYEDSQFSYGFWAVPPDLETRVLVIFAEGKVENAFWIGCIQEPITNHMTPGIASSDNVIDELGANAGNEYGSANIPAGEINRDRGVTFENYEQQAHPVHPFADTLLKQGLISDQVRGTTTSSAQRESPSQVFGMSTPGRKNTGATPKNVGSSNDPVQDVVDRTTGHTFVMDDGAADGSNQLTRLRTASGHQLLMHDTAGVVYIANGSGNAYIEMTKDGRIDIYSGIGGINLRTEGDFNLHSDSNINFHANGQIRMKSEAELIQSSEAMFNISKLGTFTSSTEGSVTTHGKTGITSYTPGQQLHGAGGRIDLAGSQVHFNSVGASPSWGPVWLNDSIAGMSSREEGDVELAKKGIEPLEMFSRQTKTTVHRFVTHEPMFRASPITSDSVIPVDVDDKKQWSRNANQPGTPEFLNQQNRLSANSGIRDAQYQADALAYVKQKMGSSTSATKAKELLGDFAKEYNTIYGISEKLNLPFDIKDSITEKVKASALGQTVKGAADDLLSSQVVEKFKNASTELFKDNVFVNSTGELFAVGEDVLKTVNLSGSTINTVKGLKNNLSQGNIGGVVQNVETINRTFTNVTGGKIIGMNTVRNIATKTGLYNASAAQLGGQTFFQNVGQNLATKIGAIGGAVKTFFSGFKFSDMRLKEQIKLIGKSPSGINIYSFKYYGIPGRYIGVMAQEVPWARHMTDTGYWAVDYNKVDVEFRRLH